MNNNVGQQRIEDPTWGNAAICVMGSRDRRTEIREMNIGGKPVANTLRVHLRSNRPKNIKITRAGSPVGNRFEKDKSLTRIEQINAFKEEVRTLWIAQGKMPEAVDQWLTARANELKAGSKLNLVCDCREHVRGFDRRSSSHPADCHGYTLALLILERSGDITGDPDLPDFLPEKSALKYILDQKQSQEMMAAEDLAKAASS